MFVENLDNIGLIKVRAVIDTSFFLKAKSVIQLQVTKTLQDGSTIDLTPGSSGTGYSLNLDASVAEISPDGLLTIKRTDLAFAYGRLPLLVTVENGEDVGFGQFAVYDTDNDKDGLADSYEEYIGIDPAIPNGFQIDTDNDGISDFFEAFLRTSPVIYDTDGDGYSDKIELTKGSDPLNFKSFPDETPLPLTLVSFTAKAKGNKLVEMEWVTTNEANIGYLQIEKSKDLKEIVQLTKIPSLVKHGSKNVYQLTDDAPFQGTSYYRLKEVDSNGKTTVYRWQTVILNREYVVSPNPASKRTFQLVVDEPKNAVIQLYEIGGGLIPIQINRDELERVEVLVPGQLSPGIYLLQVIERGQVRTHRVVLE